MRLRGRSFSKLCSWASAGRASAVFIGPRHAEPVPACAELGVYVPGRRLTLTRMLWHFDLRMDNRGLLNLHISPRMNLDWSPACKPQPLMFNSHPNKKTMKAGLAQTQRPASQHQEDRDAPSADASAQILFPRKYYTTIEKPNN